MYQTSSKIISTTEALTRRNKWHFFEEKVIFTNGCFDIVHLGHIDYLERARHLGHRLIVGLNADASVKRLKGESRPINNEMARARVLAALYFVDAVVIFEEDTPESLIALLKPDVLVKGADYDADKLPGYDIVTGYGGEVITLPLVEGYSTTGLLKGNK